jgi:hypothetical protein
MDTPTASPQADDTAADPSQGVARQSTLSPAIARVIAYGRHRQVAFAPQATVELLERPELVDVPCAPAYSLGLLSWREQWLPVIDLNALLHGQTVGATAPPYALVLAYQSAAGEPVAHGAIGLSTLPVFTAVSDTQMCAYPDDNPCWAQLALSCFQHDGLATPILHAGRLFAQYHAPFPHAAELTPAPV